MLMDRKTLSHVVAENVKALREEADLSQRELARKISKKFDPKNISNMEAARFKPNIDHIAAVATALGREPWELLRPGAHRESMRAPGLARLLSLYARSDELGREAILKVADVVGAFGKPG